MGALHPTLIGSYRQTFTTGAVTTIAAGTSTAGQLLVLRSSTVGEAARIRSLEVEFILTTAFGTPQEVGFDAYIARAFSAAPTGATALTITGNDGKVLGDEPAAVLAGRIANTGAITSGTHTLDNNAIARGSCWCSAVGAQLGPRFYDFTSCDQGGIMLLGGDGSTTCEGIVIRNTILMGATGVGKWHFTIEWDRVSV
jgi:hypothetical protein